MTFTPEQLESMAALFEQVYPHWQAYADACRQLAKITRAAQLSIDQLSHVAGTGIANVDDSIRRLQIALDVEPLPSGYQAVDW